MIPLLIATAYTTWKISDIYAPLSRYVNLSQACEVSNGGADDIMKLRRGHPVTRSQTHLNRGRYGHNDEGVYVVGKVIAFSSRSLASKLTSFISRTPQRTTPSLPSPRRTPAFSTPDDGATATPPSPAPSPSPGSPSSRNHRAKPKFPRSSRPLSCSTSDDDGASRSAECARRLTRCPGSISLDLRRGVLMRITRRERGGVRTRRLRTTIMGFWR